MKYLLGVALAACSIAASAVPVGVSWSYVATSGPQVTFKGGASFSDAVYNGNFSQSTDRRTTYIGSGFGNGTSNPPTPGVTLLGIGAGIVSLRQSDFYNLNIFEGVVTSFTYNAFAEQENRDPVLGFYYETQYFNAGGSTFSYTVNRQYFENPQSSSSVTSRGTIEFQSLPGVAPIPEPSTYALMGFGIAALGLYRRTRKLG